MYSVRAGHAVGVVCDTVIVMNVGEAGDYEETDLMILPMIRMVLGCTGVSQKTSRDSCACSER